MLEKPSKEMNFDELVLENVYLTKKL